MKPMIQGRPHPAVAHPTEMDKHPESAHPKPLERMALGVAQAAGWTSMFYFLVFWQLLWMAAATAGLWYFRFDRYPFAFLLFLSNLVQLWYLPLLQIKANRDSAASEAKADADHAALTHIAHALDELTARSRSAVSRLPRTGPASGAPPSLKSDPKNGGTGPIGGAPS